MITIYAYLSKCSFTREEGKTKRKNDFINFVLFNKEKKERYCFKRKQKKKNDRKITKTALMKRLSL